MKDWQIQRDRLREAAGALEQFGGDRLGPRIAILLRQIAAEAACTCGHEHGSDCPLHVVMPGTQAAALDLIDVILGDV